MPIDTASHQRAADLRAASGRLHQGVLSGQSFQRYGVSAFSDPSAARLKERLRRSGRFDPVHVLGMDGSGLSTVLRRIGEDEDLRERYYIISCDLPSEMNLMDAEAVDIIFVIYLCLLNGIRHIGLEPSMEGLTRLTGAAAAEYGLRERMLRGFAVSGGPEPPSPEPPSPEPPSDDLMAAVRGGFLSVTSFRRALRKDLKTDFDFLLSEMEGLCGRFSRGTYSCFRVSPEVLEKLRGEEVSSPVIEALESVRGREYKSDVSFDRMLKQVIGEVQAMYYKSVIGRHAWGESPRDALLIIDGLDALRCGFLEQMLSADSHLFRLPAAKALISFPLSISRHPFFSCLSDGAVVETHLPPDPSTPGSREAFRDAGRRRMGRVTPEDAVTDKLIAASGGLLRDYFRLLNTAAQIALSSESPVVDAECAALAIREMMDQYRRFFNERDFGDAFSAMARHEPLSDAQLTYFLRYGFALPPAKGPMTEYQMADEEQDGKEPEERKPGRNGTGMLKWRPHPCLALSLSLSCPPGKGDPDMTDSAILTPRFLAAMENLEKGDLLMAVAADPDKVSAAIADARRRLDGFGHMVLDLNPGDDIHRRVHALRPDACERAATICHVSGLENLPWPMRLDILGLLPVVRADPVFSGFFWILWVTPAYERRLFYLMPAWYRRLAGVHHPGLLPGEQTAENETDGLPDIDPWLARAVSQYENWEEASRRDEFLIPRMKAADLHRNYLPAHFINPLGRRFPLDALLSAFAAGDRLNFLLLLGGAGSGKTSFTLHAFVSFVRRYLEDPGRQRIPVFLDLSGHEGMFEAETFMMHYLENVTGRRFSLISVQEMLLTGRFFFFIDGFDHMKTAVERQATAANLEEIAKLSGGNTVLMEGVETRHPGNKIFMTCRSHFFLERVTDTEPEDAGQTSLYRDLASLDHFQMVHMGLKEVDGDELKQYIRAAAGGEVLARNLLSMFQTAETAEHLAPVELFQEMGLRVLPMLRSLNEITPADVYRAAVRLWICQDDWRNRLTDAGRRELLTRLALKMFRNDVRQLHYSELGHGNPANEKPAFRGTITDGYADELNSCEFVIRDDVGNWRFIRPSFFDYLLAENVFRLVVRKHRRLIPYARLTEGMWRFFRDLAASSKRSLAGLDFSDTRLENANFYQAVMPRAILKKACLRNTVLVQADLRRADLTNADGGGVRLSRADLREADLSGAGLPGAMARHTNFQNTCLNGVILKDADCRKACFRNARMAWADLRGVRLDGADLSGAVLTDADLSGASLSGAQLEKADLSGANLLGALLDGVNAAGANFEGANLSNAGLESADLSEAGMRGATLAMARMKQADLRRAFLVRIKAVDVDLREADLQDANLEEARLQEARLDEARLSRAKLLRARLTGANLSWAGLDEARLSGADFTDAVLHMARLISAEAAGAVFESADLTWVNARNAVFSNSDFTGARLNDGEFTGADFRKARFRRTRLAGAVLRGADLEGVEEEDLDVRIGDFSGTGGEDAEYDSAAPEPG